MANSDSPPEAARFHRGLRVTLDGAYSDAPATLSISRSRSSSSGRVPHLLLPETDAMAIHECGGNHSNRSVSPLTTRRRPVSHKNSALTVSPSTVLLAVTDIHSSIVSSAASFIRGSVSRLTLTGCSTEAMRRIL